MAEITWKSQKEIDQEKNRPVLPSSNEITNQAIFDLTLEIIELREEIKNIKGGEDHV